MEKADKCPYCGSSEPHQGPTGCKTNLSERCPVSGQTHEGCESHDRTDFHIKWHLDRMVVDGEVIKNADGSYSEGTLKT